MVILILLHDIGSSLMFYGGLLAILYVATGRVSFVVIGVVAVRPRRLVPGDPHRSISTPGSTLGCIRSRRPTTTPSGEASSSPTRSSCRLQAACSVLGLVEATLTVPGTSSPGCPLPETDMIYAVITGELGLFGATGLLTRLHDARLARGFKAATLARDSFSKLMATGLSAVLALQVFVIVGGVTRVIPLTGVTLPFVSYGGSSIVANFVLVALLLLVSDRARRQHGEEPAMNRSIARLFAIVIVLFGALIAWTSRWTVFESQRTAEPTAEQAAVLRVAEGQARPDPRRRRHACWPSRCRPAAACGTAKYPPRPAVRAADRLLDPHQAPAGGARGSTAPRSSAARSEQG